jgi:hypothetical protein
MNKLAGKVVMRVIKQIFKWLMIVIIVLLLSLVARCQYSRSLSLNGHPADNRMLEHFNQHRAEFEKLVQYHRQYDYLEQVKPGLAKLNIEEQNALLNQAGVKRVYGTLWGWMATKEKIVDRHLMAKFAPISATHFLDQDRPVKSVDNIHSTFYRHPYDGARESPEEIKKFKKEMPSYFFDSDVNRSLLTPIADLSRIIEIELAEPRYSIFSNRRKVYMHFPRPPIIQNNRIMVHSPLEGDRKLVTVHRIVDSLDNPPSDWNNECILKSIDTLWYISLYECGKPIDSNS